MSEKAPYSVEPYRADQPEPHTGDIVHVDAEGPLEAAQQVLGEPLAMNGKAESLRCRVWRLDADFRPIAVMLYAKP